jgi:RNA recognition motif-containing protein
MRKSLFVGNIPYGALESEIRTHFSSVGEVLEVQFMMDWQRGRFRGFGFVTMEEAEARQAVERLNNLPFQGRRLKVSISKPSPARADRQTA